MSLDKEELKKKMRDRNSGVLLANRSTMWKSFKKCFTGAEAVGWVADTGSVSREEAVAVLTQFLQEQFITALNGAATDFRDDATAFYGFSQPKTVVVVGGGMAGTTIVRDLYKKFRVVLLDGRGLFQCTPSLPYVVCDPTRYRKISFLHEETFGDRVMVMRHNVVDVISEDRQVVLDNGEKISYDYLVLCTGSRYDPPGPLRQLPEGTKVKLVNPMSSEQILACYNELLTADNVVVVGGGPTGIEVVGEIAAAFPNKHISLVSSRDRMLERCCADAHETALKALKSFSNIHFYLGERLDHVTTSSIVTDKGSDLPCSLCFFAVGFTPNTEFLKERNASVLDDRGQVKVDKYLMVEGLQDVFALGDITNVDEEKLAQNADKHAETVAATIQALETRNMPVAYAPAVRYLIITLGPKRAMIVKGDSVVMEGKLASRLKTIIEKKVMMFHK